MCSKSTITIKEPIKADSPLEIASMITQPLGREVIRVSLSRRILAALYAFRRPL